jgi:hypothetical protein
VRNLETASRNLKLLLPTLQAWRVHKRNPEYGIYLIYRITKLSVPIIYSQYQCAIAIYGFCYLIATNIKRNSPSREKTPALSSSCETTVLPLPPCFRVIHMAIKVCTHLAAIIPPCGHEGWDKWMAYLPHALHLLASDRFPNSSSEAITLSCRKMPLQQWPSTPSSSYGMYNVEASRDVLGLNSTFDFHFWNTEESSRGVLSVHTSIISGIKLA